MPKKRLLASFAVAAGLTIGGVVGVILGVPAVSQAQTTTVPPAEDTTPPADPGTPAAPDEAKPHDENCPNMDGERGVRPKMARRPRAPSTAMAPVAGEGAPTACRQIPDHAGRTRWAPPPTGRPVSPALGFGPRDGPERRRPPAPRAPHR